MTHRLYYACDVYDSQALSEVIAAADLTEN
jgi:hypothetical protein